MSYSGGANKILLFCLIFELQCTSIFAYLTFELHTQKWLCTELNSKYSPPILMLVLKRRKRNRTLSLYRIQNSNTSYRMQLPSCIHVKGICNDHQDCWASPFPVWIMGKSKVEAWLYRIVDDCLVVPGPWPWTPGWRAGLNRKRK